MSYSSMNTSEKLTFSREALQIAIDDPLISEVLAGFGFTQDRLSGGLTIQESARSLDSDQQVEYGASIEATALVRESYNNVRSAFQADRRIVLTVLRDQPGLAEKLRLSGGVERRRNALLHQVRHFYEEIQSQEELRIMLEPYSFTTELLDARLTQVDAYALALKQQQYQRGQWLITALKRQEAMRELDNWMAQFIGVARQAFRNDKRQLEKLGISAR